jgi:hypothetical protein
MDVRGYDVRMSEHLWSYEFYSEGPKGKVKKIIQYFPFYLEGKTCFNLFLGDWNEEKKLFDDVTVTNNKDSIKVLTTVAQTVIEFTDSFPDAFVHIKGNTASRTRLYLIGIAKNWTDISTLFTVFGNIDNKWQLFLKNVNYEAFMINRKNTVNL